MADKLELTIEDVWNQAKADDYASVLDGDTYDSRLVFGIKIAYDYETEAVTLWNTGKGGDFYNVIEDLEPFLQRGWRYGVYTTALDNYKFKLDKVEQSMRNEINGKRNPKQIKSLKNQRVKLLSKYNYISEKLNQIK